jgi:hypothetical protein
MYRSNSRGEARIRSRVHWRILGFASSGKVVGRFLADMAKPPKKNEARPARPGSSVLPMELRVGDRFTDETGEWEIVSQPYTISGGKVVYARVKQVGELAVTEERSWGAHEKVAVRRA